MNLAYKKILGKFTKVLGFGKTPPPHVGKISQIMSFFLFESVPNIGCGLCGAPEGTNKMNVNVEMEN